MNKLKIILVVAGLLVTGFVAGFLTNRQLVKNHIHRVRQWDREEQFGDRILQRVEATTEQREALRPLLENYGEKYHQLTQDQRQTRKAFFDSLHQEMSPYLDSLQQEKLERVRGYIQRGPVRRPNGHDGPPEGDRNR
jgi:type VI protein secretion system component VasK